MFNMEDFVKESNRIEGITGRIGYTELDAYEWFTALTEPSIEDLMTFVSIVQPGAVLRNKPGQNVKVGEYFPPSGGPQIEKALTDLLDFEYSPYELHVEYEVLHPFTDCNGRSGRALWLHSMGGIIGAPLGFLHTFYYQTLERAEI